MHGQDWGSWTIILKFYIICSNEDLDILLEIWSTLDHLDAFRRERNGPAKNPAIILSKLGQSSCRHRQQFLMELNDSWGVLSRLRFFGIEHGKGTPNYINYSTIFARMYCAIAVQSMDVWHIRQDLLNLLLLVCCTMMFGHLQCCCIVMCWHRMSCNILYLVNHQQWWFPSAPAFAWFWDFWDCESDYVVHQ